MNLYCRTDQWELVRFLSECIQWVKANRVAESHLILGGDMNCVEYQSDRSSFMLDKSSDVLRDLKCSLNVCDVWKSVHPDDIDFTYIDPSYRNYNSKIDVLCVSLELERRVIKCTHEVTPCPDHKAVVMCLKVGDKKRLKLNGSLM